MTEKVLGGQTTYGHVVGILMNDSAVPRIPGDPGHAQTFSFPVVYETLEGFPFEDLITLNKDHVDILIQKAKALQEKGVSLIAADCGLFGPFQSELKKHLKVPFMGSALDMVPLLHHLLPANKKVGIITGDTTLLKAAHFEASGIHPGIILMAGMQYSAEFRKVVMKKEGELDIAKMRQEVLEAALSLPKKDLGAIVLECTNLISFRSDIQKAMGVPVFDLVTLIEFYVSALRFHPFQSRFINANCSL